MDVAKEWVCINFCFGNNWQCFEVETWLSVLADNKITRVWVSVCLSVCDLSYTVAIHTHYWCNRMNYCRSRSSKVIDFGTNRKCVYIFPSVVNSNFLRPHLAPFQRYGGLCKCPISTSFPYPTPIPAKIWGCSLWIRSVGLTENAGVENAAPSKLQGWKTREWKTRHQVQGLFRSWS